MMRYLFLFLLALSLASWSGATALAQDEVISAPEEVPAVENPPITETPASPESVEGVATEVPASPEANINATPTEATTITEPVVPEATEPTDSAEGATETTEAQTEETPVPLSGLSIDVPVEKQIYDQLVLRKPPLDIEKMPSLFLTVWERDLIINARKGLQTRDPDAPDTTPEVSPVDLSMYESPRDLRLSGIVYRSKKDWVIWLNAKRIAPNALPKEIMDIKVYKDYIELEWFDAQTNQIFPVRLRPHQRFNLDARVFLPG